MSTNGFFGHIQGPFNANENIVDLMQNNCNKTINYISKLGICYNQNYFLDVASALDNNSWSIPIIVTITDDKTTSTFQIGKTGILELEDVKISSIVFSTETPSNIFIEYQYE